MVPRSSGNERTRTGSLEQGLEQRIAGRRGPVPLSGRQRTSGYLPAGLEATKMVDAQQVEALALQRNARAPPREAMARHRVPVVVRIAPALPRGAEVIGWYARLDGECTIGIHTEQAA